MVFQRHNGISGILTLKFAHICVLCIFVILSNFLELEKSQFFCRNHKGKKKLSAHVLGKSFFRTN